jgi:hypothetical protein
MKKLGNLMNGLFTADPEDEENDDSGSSDKGETKKREMNQSKLESGASLRLHS